MLMIDGVEFSVIDHRLNVMILYHYDTVQVCYMCDHIMCMNEISGPAFRSKSFRESNVEELGEGRDAGRNGDLRDIMCGFYPEYLNSVRLVILEQIPVVASDLDHSAFSGQMCACH